MALRLKANVNLDGLTPQILIALQAAQQEYADHGYDCWITSVTDGKHSANSLHYAGKAIDLRTKHLPLRFTQIISDNLRKHLSPQFDVVLEPTHLHIEYDPS